MAFQRARASQGRSSWVAELYGREPDVITHAISRITYELMIEQGRQEEMALAESRGGVVKPDLDLQSDPESGYRWIRAFREGRLRVRF